MRHYPERTPRSPSGHWTATRDRAAQARFRAALIRRAGHRCEWLTLGRRCVATTRLQAHHTQPGVDDPASGLLLCTEHHHLIDEHAR